MMPLWMWSTLLIPLGFIGWLVWLRLRAGGASHAQAFKMLLALGALGAIFVGSVSTAVNVWRTAQWQSAVSGVVGAVAFLTMRRVLQRAWERFPLG